MKIIEFLRAVFLWFGFAALGVTIFIREEAVDVFYRCLKVGILFLAISCIFSLIRYVLKKRVA